MYLKLYKILVKEIVKYECEACIWRERDKEQKWQNKDFKNSQMYVYDGGKTKGMEYVRQLGLIMLLDRLLQIGK
jgi:hypothetical protein